MALVAPSDAQGFQAILSPGRIAAVPLHRVVQRPQPVAAQVEVKEQVELAGGFLYRQTIAGGSSNCSAAAPNTRVTSGWSSPTSSLS